MVGCDPVVNCFPGMFLGDLQKNYAPEISCYMVVQFQFQFCVSMVSLVSLKRVSISTFSFNLVLLWFLIDGVIQN